MAERLVSIIAAMDEKRGIGKNGKIPWEIPGEQKYFKEKTLGHPIVMGRKTHESIGRVLPGRLNIVITRDVNYQANEQVLVVHSIKEALERANYGPGETFVIGGREIYIEALPFANKLYLTLIEGDFEADVNFPEYSGFGKVVGEQQMEVSSKGKIYRYKNVVLERN